jgi:CubicO group peptidase (beta-lactamase class C family)
MHDRVADNLDQIVGRYLKNNLFSACSIGFFRIDNKERVKKFFYYGKNRPERLANSSVNRPSQGINSNSVYDLASLTKPLVTSLSLLCLIEQKRISVDDTLKNFFEMENRDIGDISIQHLLNHSSGLAAHNNYYSSISMLPMSERKDRIISMILGEKLHYRVGSRTVYSDLGYILLGKIIELVSGKSLDKYWQEKIVVPLHLEKGLFYGASERVTPPGRYVSTGNCTWSASELCGQVHDDNCRAIGGVAGHAGLFGTLAALLSLCEFMVLLYKNEVKHPFISAAGFRAHINTRVNDRRFGFDIPTGKIPSCGSSFSELTVGHLGFTGTSFWLDLKKDTGIAVLTNRVCYAGGQERIRQFRPLVHDTIMQHLLKTKNKM